MANAPNLNATAKSAPGKVRLKCMIWEPQPVNNRKQQDDHFSYTADTVVKLKTLSDDINIFYGEPSGIYLKENYVYRDTFLSIGKEFLIPEKAKAVDFNGHPLFDPKTGEPASPWVSHQTFELVGSLYSRSIVTPSGLATGAPGAFDFGTSIWSYYFYEVPANRPGAPGIANSLDDFDSSSIVPGQEATVQSRQTHRFLPVQLKASMDAQKAATTGTTSSGSTSGSNGSTKPTPIHWLAIKKEPMFRGEDFFVEFVRTSYSPDIVVQPDKTNMLSEYAAIDSLSNVTVQAAKGTSFQDGTQPPPACLALVSLKTDGTVDEASKDQMSLAKQPYYVIELGHGDPDHNYWIILAYNANPVLVHVTDSAGILLPGQVGTDPSSSVPPTVFIPDQKTSRRLGVYKISCKQLMDQGKLRLTVRNHMGKLVITFNGYENDPWIIDRWDYNEKSFASVNKDVINDILQTKYHAHVAPAPIQIGAGNIPCGFSFAPLHYRPVANLVMPDGICVKGPVTQDKVNCLLAEKDTRDVKGKTVSVYFQDADVWYEVVSGAITTTTRISKINFDSPAKEYFWIKGYNTRPSNPGPTPPANTPAPTVPAPNNPPNRGLEPTGVIDIRPTGTDGYLSFIRIAMQTDLAAPNAFSTGTPPAQPVGPPPKAYSVGDVAQYFRAAYQLGAGDCVVGKDKTKWIIANCITPVAFGWRLYVPPSEDFPSIKPIDVAHHVTHVSVNSTYSDNLKVERSGSVKFIINPGKMTSIGNPLVAGQDPAYGIDRSNYLASLNNKFFTIRIYAWWEGGFMDCSKNDQVCNAAVGAPEVAAAVSGVIDSGQKNPITDPNAAAGVGDDHVLFTGFCNASSITQENGKRYMECQLVDYWKVLQDARFLNSPFFDGMRDFNATYEVLKIAGFSSFAGKQDKYPPLGFIKRCAESKKGTLVLTDLGQMFITNDYGLPSGYGILQSPLFKFGDGSTMDEAIIKFAQHAGKLVYFDRYGIFRLVTRPDLLTCVSIAPKYNFFASPANMLHKVDYFSLMLNSYTYKRVVNDVFNEIQVISCTPEGELIIASGVNLPGKLDPTSEGYVGYTKRFLQLDGIFGNVQSVKNVVNYYSGFYKPPITVSWESWGMAKLQASDLVTVTGLKTDHSFPKQNLPGANIPKGAVTLYITSLSSEIIAEKNDWKNKYEGEWIFFGSSGCKTETAPQDNNGVVGTTPTIDRNDPIHSTGSFIRTDFLDDPDNGIITSE